MNKKIIFGIGILSTLIISAVIYYNYSLRIVAVEKNNIIYYNNETYEEVNSDVKAEKEKYLGRVLFNSPVYRFKLYSLSKSGYLLVDMPFEKSHYYKKYRRNI